ncbi:MAG: P-loop ATPase, Sll1717 family [Bacteroidota bacterium]
MKKGFFGYPSLPKSSSVCIEEAIEEINKGSVVSITSWTKMKIGGKIIIEEILDLIDSCDFACFDITGLNDNVLFEMGYALAKGKPVWIINDTSLIESMRRLKEFQILLDIGYRNYHNSDDIIKQFYSDQPYEDLKPILTERIKTRTTNIEQNALLFLKGQFSTNYNQVIVNNIEKYNLPTVIDDASETKIQSLNWYLDQLLTVPAIISEFSSSQKSGHQLQNSKSAFISGIATGLQLKVLMVAEEPYEETPMDYRGLLLKYHDKESCNNATDPFLSHLHNEIAELLVNKRNNLQNKRKSSDLQKINFGEYIAEHESEIIYDYYIETTHFQSLIKNEYNIVIGRKGSGKTATLYYLEKTLEHDKRNIVCMIKPINFEIDGLVSILEKGYGDFENGYLIESVWKFLIYTEIAKALYKRTRSKPIYAFTNSDKEFCEFVDLHSRIILTDFSSRLQEQISVLIEDETIAEFKQSDFKLKISEILHDQIIFKIREWIPILVPTDNKVVVLIDNLDKSWRKNSRLNVIGKCILGLLGVTGRIAREFNFVKPKHIKIPFHLTIFLRSDIFSFILKLAREPDKIEQTRLKWEDPEIFFRIIEERFLILNDNAVSRDDLWLKYIVARINNINTKEYIIQRVLPRPRDIIYFFKSSKDYAISRGHTRIEAADLVSAYEEYSSWVFKSIIVENGITLEQMEDFMYELLGHKSIISKSMIIELMKKAKINTSEEIQIENFIDHLVSLTIIGREIGESLFQFEYDSEKSKKIKVQSEHLKSNRYKIHPAFHPYLEINCDPIC